MANIGIIGAGTWGCALAAVLSDNGHKVCLWAYQKEEAELIGEKRQCPNLPGAVIPDGIEVTMDIGKAASGRDMIVMAVPSVATRSTAEKVAPHTEKGCYVVTVSKGIEEGTLLTQSQILEQVLSGAVVGALSGPTHAEEVIRRRPTAIVAGATDRSLALLTQEFFMNENFRVYTSSDLLGIELGGALKNVIALAAGMCDGIDAGDNAKAALMTRGIKEISSLAVEMGAQPETLSGLAGIGDLIVTCGSVHSRNHRAGELIGKGASCDEAMKEVKMVVEGVYSAKAAAALGKKYGIEMPITETVNDILFNNLPVKDALYLLMSRDKKAEYEY